MKHAAILFVIALAFACSPDSSESPEPVETWGDVSTEIAHSICWHQYNCDENDNIDLCMEDEILNLCGLDATCEEPVHNSIDSSYSTVETLVYQCAFAIYDLDCSDEEFEWPQNCVHMLMHLQPRIDD